MCGIAGFVVHAATQDLSAILRSMAKVIPHRGPDDEGFFEVATNSGTSRVGLAHRRLSIIDLSAGHQPIGNEDGSIQIVFNGEIYNFEELRRLRSQCGHRSHKVLSR
jgi:asparagine synthase (glutamine-hydrolysing)